MNYEDCKIAIEACSASAIATLHCARKDMNELDVNQLVECIRLDQEAANISLLTMRALASGSPFIKQICLLCSEICNACATECEKHSHMEHCKKSADACRKTAIECIKMSKY